MTDDLEDLPGVGPATAEKLANAGFESFQGIAIASSGELARIANISESIGRDVIDAAREKEGIGAWDSGASNIIEEREAIASLKTGHRDFDELIGGGIETQALTEFYGNEGSGRTAIAHLLAVRAQLPTENGGLGGQVGYIDSRGLFSPERIANVVDGLGSEDRQALAASYDVEDSTESITDAVLDHIYVSNPSDVRQQILHVEELHELAEEFESSDHPLRLVLVDSVTFHFRAEYQGRGDLAERQQKLNKHLHDLIRIGDLHGTGVIITNGMSNDSRPYGGNLLHHTSTYRIQLKKTSGEVRKAVLVDAPSLPDGKVDFYLRDGHMVPE